MKFRRCTLALALGVSLAAAPAFAHAAPSQPTAAPATITVPFTCPAGPAVTVGPAWTVSGPRVVKETPSLVQVACDYYREVPGGFPVYPERAYIFISWVPIGAKTLPSDLPSGVCGVGAPSPGSALSPTLYAWAAVNGQWWSGAPGDGDTSAAALSLGANLLSTLDAIARACRAPKPTPPTAEPQDAQAVTGGLVMLQAAVTASTKVRYHVRIRDARGSVLRELPAPGKWSNLVDVASGTLVIAAKGVPPKATQWCIRVIDTAKQASNESCAALSQGPDTEAPDVIALGGDLTTLAYRVLDNSGRAREEIFVGFMNEMVQTVNVPMHAARGQLTQVPWIPDAKILNGIKAGRPVLMCVVAIDPAGNRSDEAPDAAPECATVSPTVAGS